MIKLVAFDLDDTLYNEREFVLGGFSSVCRYLSIKYSIEYNSLIEYCINDLDLYGRGKIFNHMCERYNFNENIEDMISIYRNTVPKLELYDDAEKIIQQLQGRYKLGIITDGVSSVQWNKIKALKLEDNFDKIIVTDDLGRDYWKPNKHCFEDMLKYFCINAKEAAYVGDNPNKDFIGAKDAGYLTVRIVRKSGDFMRHSVSKEYDADYIINNLNELINLF